jgi:hypothetical protein
LAATVIANTTKAPTNSFIGTALQDPLESLSATSSKDEVKQAIVYTAKNNGVDPEIMIALAGCESGFKDICITDTNNKLSCGFFMFQKTTLKGYCPDLHWGDLYPADGIICAARMIKQGLLKAHWVHCAKSIL